MERVLDFTANVIPCERFISGNPDSAKHSQKSPFVTFFQLSVCGAGCRFVVQVLDYDTSEDGWPDHHDLEYNFVEFQKIYFLFFRRDFDFGRKLFMFRNMSPNQEFPRNISFQNKFENIFRVISPKLNCLIGDKVWSLKTLQIWLLCSSVISILIQCKYITKCSVSSKRLRILYNIRTGDFNFLQISKE